MARVRRGRVVLLIIMRHQDGAADTFPRRAAPHRREDHRAVGASWADRASVDRRPPACRTTPRPGRSRRSKSAARGVRKHRVTPRRLEIRDLTVSYGGITVVRNVSMSIEPGQIVGLIGPNGAGKTTLVDAATGFVKYTGEVVLDGRRLDRLPPHRRARAGLTRSFQSLEIFEDRTVAENLRVVSDPGGACPTSRTSCIPRTFRSRRRHSPASTSSTSGRSSAAFRQSSPTGSVGSSALPGPWPPRDSSSPRRARLGPRRVELDGARHPCAPPCH